jgi:hypothetical protein
MLALEIENMTYAFIPLSFFVFVEEVIILKDVLRGEEGLNRRMAILTLIDRTLTCKPRDASIVTGTCHSLQWRRHDGNLGLYIWRGCALARD